jgi:hypothetical protein
MWGNRVGWGISVLLMFLMFAGLYLMYEEGQPSGPSEAFQKKRKVYLAVMQLPIPPSEIVPMDDPSDATKLYQQAVESYRAKKADYENYDGGPKEPEAVALVLQATHCKSGHVLQFASDEMANYQYGMADAQRPPLEAIAAIHKAIFLRAATVGPSAKDPNAPDKNKRLEDKRRYIEAMFAMGAKMFEERINFAEFEMASGFMRGDAAQLQAIAIARNDPVPDQLKEFVPKCLAWRKEHVEFLNSFIPAIDPNILADHAGDYFVLARDCKDRMWRVEAILQLGRLRYRIGDNGHSGDQPYANRLLADLAKNEPDPIVEKAATQALELTAPNFRLQH